MKKKFLLTFGVLVLTANILPNGISSAYAKATNNTITSEKATEIALAKTGGGTVTKCEIDYDDGIIIYEIEIYNNSIEYDVDVNATNSQIVKFEQETLKTSPNQTPIINEINLEKAKSVALAKTNGGDILKWEIDYEDGIKIYEFEIINGNIKYDLDVGAVDSKIYNFKQQTIKTTGKNTYTSTLSVAANEITELKAKEIALAKAGGGTILSCYVDYENGRKVYEIVAINNNVKYEMDIATADGTIYDYEEKIIKSSQGSTNKPNQNPQPSTQISAEKAKEIALGKSGGGMVTQCELDNENGVLVYEIEIVNGNYEYSMDVNASTGAVSDFEKELED